MDRSALSPPNALAPARAQAHGAVQLLYRAAVGNLAALPGDEQSNLGWDIEAGTFRTHPLDEAGTMAGLSLTPLCLSLGSSVLTLDGRSVADAQAWLDAELGGLGLKPASEVALAYDLPNAVQEVDRFAQVEGLAALAAWFTLAAETIGAQVIQLAGLRPGPSDVRCWPHHFDIGTYISLETGDPEEARGIGVGLSPGDESYDQPYFYVNPWPRLSTAVLPPPVAPGHWHTEGFVGLIATGDEILSLSDPVSVTTAFLTKSIGTCRSLQGI